MINTLEELHEYKKQHCGIDCERPATPCKDITTQALREEYAAKYGCICAINCKRCMDYKSCRPYECAGEARRREACKKA